MTITVECNHVEAMAYSLANNGVATHCDECGSSVTANRRKRTAKHAARPPRGLMDLARDAQLIARREQIEGARAIDYNPEVRGDGDGVPSYLDDASARGQQAHANRLRQRLQQIEREHDDASQTCARVMRWLVNSGGKIEGGKNIFVRGQPIARDALGTIADALSTMQSRSQWSGLREAKPAARVAMELLRSQAGEALVVVAVERWWRR